MSVAPTIIFVPGMKPKPEPALHRDAVLRCLVEGLRRVDAPMSEWLAANNEHFVLAAWTQLFYDQFRDIGEDIASIDAAIAKSGADATDISEASSLKTRLRRAAYLLGDSLPFLIPRFAGADMQITLRDVRRYARNDDNIGRTIRRNLRLPLRRAWHADSPILLIGHSLGSVIAWDTLWELSRVDGVGGNIDTFMTLGSPLGQGIIQRAIKGSKERGRRRYPDNIRRWCNIASVGELTALDHRFARDFAPMQRFGLVKSIEDHRIYSHYRQDGKLMVHSEYGYLLASTTAQQIAAFCHRHVSPNSD